MELTELEDAYDDTFDENDLVAVAPFLEHLSVPQHKEIVGIADELAVCDTDDKKRTVVTQMFQSLKLQIPWLKAVLAGKHEPIKLDKRRRLLTSSRRSASLTL